MQFPGSDMVRATVIHTDACHFCDDAYRTLTEIATDHPLNIEMVPVDSEQGRALVATHRPAMFPLILLDGEYFSAGRLPRRKLLATLRKRATTPSIEKAEA